MVVVVVDEKYVRLDSPFLRSRLFSTTAPPHLLHMLIFTRSSGLAIATCVVVVIIPVSYLLVCLFLWMLRNQSQVAQNSINTARSALAHKICPSCPLHKSHLYSCTPYSPPTNTNIPGLT